ncbi:hypothetical protein KL953_09970 [Mycolicibacterium goodii]|uniref:hypothetical protein n=1 Tax=Mycolicibacterium goodii TaxID=134601 RepID=UPI001BDC767D|nr:hypothetical protein [Mycolicibacterium goodii]MBU8809221.1 hypothetical protein [Mycolicibacterium goodii]
MVRKVDDRRTLSPLPHGTPVVTVLVTKHPPSAAVVSRILAASSSVGLAPASVRRAAAAVNPQGSRSPAPTTSHGRA